MKLVLTLSTGFALVLSSPSAFASQLLQNPSFEIPVVTSSTTCFAGVANCESFTVGSSMGAWTVVGSAGPAAPAVDILTSSYTENGGSLHFDPESGNQALDLTGDFNQGANGVEQTVATTAGASYMLSFFVGNQDNAQPNYPLNSSVSLLLNGTLFNTYTNANSSTNDVAWQNFTATFAATGSTTTIEFLNATAAGDNYAGLDNVTLNTATPEPAALWLGLAAAGALGMRSRLARRR